MEETTRGADWKSRAKMTVGVERADRRDFARKGFSRAHEEKTVAKAGGKISRAGQNYEA